MTRSFSAALAIIFLTAGALLIWLAGPPDWTVKRVQAASRTFTPFTVSLLETTTGASGAKAHARRIAALRSDGSMIEVDQSLDNQGNTTADQRQMTLADRLIVQFSPSVQAKSTRRSKADDFALFYVGAKRAATQQCLATVSGERTLKTMGEVFIGNEPVSGWQTVHTRIQQPNSPVIDSWHAPGLGCALLKQVIGYATPNQTGALVTGRSEKVAEWILAGEPDTALFTIPERYEEVRPSELAGRLAERRTGSRAFLSAAALKAADERYFAQRP